MAKKLSVQFVPERTQLGHIGVVPPWADTDKIKPIKKLENPLAAELGQENCITILYSGNMGKSHDIPTMLNAAKLLSEYSMIKFLFIGSGDQWSNALNFKNKENLANVQVLPFQSESRLPFTMALGDISLVSLDKGAEGLMVPSKMYYYMAAGSAIIGICEGENDIKESLKIAKCGQIVNPGSAQQLADTILKLASNLEELERLKINSRNASTSLFSRNTCVKKFKYFLTSLTF
jgi:glycosyltransferase involved in cell wall biosynthesis